LKGPTDRLELFFPLLVRGSKECCGLLFVDAGVIVEVEIEADVPGGFG
jgi:hypothetical protein